MNGTTINICKKTYNYTVCERSAHYRDSAKNEAPCTSNPHTIKHYSNIRRYVQQHSEHTVNSHSVVLLQYRQHAIIHDMTKGLCSVSTVEIEELLMNNALKHCRTTVSLKNTVSKSTAQKYYKSYSGGQQRTSDMQVTFTTPPQEWALERWHPQ